jgi:hypothetical protein
MTRPLEELQTITAEVYDPDTTVAVNNSGDDRIETTGDDEISARDETEKARNWRIEEGEGMVFGKAGSLISKDYLLGVMKALTDKVECLDNKNRNLESEISGIKHGQNGCKRAMPFKEGETRLSEKT